MVKTETLRFVEEGHRYFHGERELIGITKTLEEAGVIDKKAFYTEEACAKGKAVHVAAHYLDENDLDWETMDPSIEGYIRAYEKAKKEIGCDPSLIPFLIEKSVCNLTYGLAGRLDRYAPGMLIELKSGVVEPWAGLQLAAQEICLLSGDNDFGYSFPTKIKRYALELNPNGSYKLHPFNDPRDKDVFLSFLTGVQWRRNHK